MRDGICLNATLYLPEANSEPAPCLVAFTPYTAQRNHHRAKYFATNGFPFLVVDVRGRGGSEGTFRPFRHEAEDGCDVIDWAAGQPFCDGRVAMFSGSYEGYAQWAVARKSPPKLSAIAPAMAAAPGIDFPMRCGIATTYLMRWLTFVTDRTSQETIFADRDFWAAQFRRWHEAGRPFRDLDTIVGNPSAIFQEWLAHPTLDAYWDSLLPTAAEFARLDLPILTITGAYDSNQAGALYYYREHLRHASPVAMARHYLVIGPWDHGSTLAPKPQVGGISLAPAALIDVLKLHCDWYNWVLRGGQRPAFLRQAVAYYVTGAEQWRYSDTLEAITAKSVAYYLYSQGNATDEREPGTLLTTTPAESSADHYVYDPRHIDLAELESTVDPECRCDQRMTRAAQGRVLMYQGVPFETDIEVSGFFKLHVWLSIDQSDTDFYASVYEVALDGGTIELTTDWMRARYRDSMREPKLVDVLTPLRYKFERFPFISRRINKGHYLRLIIGPLNSIYSQKNYNSGGVVADESMRDARPVTVRLYHDPEHPSALYVPFGQTAG